MLPPVTQLAIVFGAGLWSGIMFVVPTVFVCALLACSVVSCVVSRWRGVLVLAAVIGFCTGGAVAAGKSRECSSVWRRGSVSAILRIHDSPGPSGVTNATVLHHEHACSGAIRVRFDSNERIPSGVRVVAVGTHRGRGVLRVVHVRILNGRRSVRYALRGAVANRIQDLYGPRAGLVEAVVLGRRENIDKPLRDEFAKAGLAHLLAISGLHVGVLGGWCVILARCLGARRKAWAWGIAIVWIYVGSLGFPAPATRAASFMSIIGLARIRQRHPPPGAVLSVALMVVVAIDPSAATSVGAWLSALAVWGTRAGVEAMGRFRLLGASVGATIATAPITAFAFGTVAPVGILANLVAVPLASLAVPGLFVSLMVGGIVAGGTGLTFAIVERVASIGASIPGGNIVGIPGLAFAGPWFGLLCFVGWLHTSKPNWVVVRRRAVSAAVVACWCLMAQALTTRRERSGDLLLYVLSVGQGDAIALRTPRGLWVLVDGGPRSANFDAGRNVVIPFFRRKGVSRLAAVVVSHGDADHLGGIPAVVREMVPALVLDPGQPLGTELYLDYLRSLDMVGAEWRPARAGDSFVLDSVEFEVLHPSAEWMSSRLDPNENSVVLRVEYGCFSAVLTGDIGHSAESLLATRVGEVNFLKVAHHGSSGSTGQPWIDVVRPSLAVISVGKNRFGHPAPSVVDRLQEAGTPLFRTDDGGTVTIRSDGSYLESVQGGAATNLSEKLGSLIRPWLRSRGSSSKERGNIGIRRVKLPACKTRKLLRGM